MGPVDPAVFGQNLQRLRLAAGLSQDQLAQRMGGTSTVGGFQIRRLEKGQNVPRPRTITALAEALGVPSSELLRSSAEQGERETCARIADQYGQQMAREAITAPTPHARTKYRAAESAAIVIARHIREGVS